MSAPTWVARSKDARFSNLMMIAAIGEIMIDKLPFIPARVSAPQITFRALSGAGSAVYAHWEQRQKLNLILLGLAGAFSAVLSTHASYQLRRQIGLRLRLPDPWVGAIEDLIVHTAGARLLRSHSPATDAAA
jgi:uncharacterized membrane protein